MNSYSETVITSSPEETIEAGKKLGSRLTGGEVIAYKGGLGAGKTTFTRGLAMGMGLEDNVSSPTFAIVNEYHGDNLSLYHFDMYRINGGEALETTGFFDYMSEDSVIAAEWSENIEDELDGSTITVTLEPLENGGRRITLTDPKGGNKFAGTWN
ncbi:MAG: tRNA (adenosine(37)-N6)-threonylcarbamoyltransferase complex ATPase subunit type 1 TsaE [Oscillospiraceae bacterium]|nr:tRNA (adenosine(37)-N6)-threonylcarbamoyltransferase complex ATPase subunit type 1 TsaE [Oscillospiraceae bacterium]